MINSQPTHDVICPHCGQMNPPASRVCQNCMGSLVQPTAPPSRQAAPRAAPIRPAPPVYEEPVRARPVGERTFERSMRPSVRRRGPVGRFADNLRQIAYAQPEEETEKPSWFNPKLAAVALAFFAMIGFRGDDVIDNLTDE